MHKQLILSAAAALLLSPAYGASMYDEFNTMKDEIEALKSQIAEMKSNKSPSQDIEDEDEEQGVTSDASYDDEDETYDDEESDDDEDEEEDDEGDEEDDEEEVEVLNNADLSEAVADLEDSLGTIRRNTSGNHIKFSLDFRTAVDNLQYKMADGSNIGNDALLTNRLWLNMDWAPTQNISFRGQLAYNKAYGHRSGWGQNYPGFETFDWITNTNPYDDVVRLKAGYFLYRDQQFLGADIPWTFSIGRRPSTNGHIINMRDDDVPASPQGHSINVEFDGLSAKFTLWESMGTYVKFCAGRGGTNAAPKFFSVNMQTGAPSITAPYAKNPNDLPDIDLGGLIFVPYDDGQYNIATQYYRAVHLIDANLQPVDPTNPSQGVYFAGMQDVGSLDSITGSFTISGIGNEWSDYLDDTVLFISGAMSKTNPNSSAGGMLGSTDSKTGYSLYAGLQVPSLLSEEGKWGLEYNQGSKYWRSITYGEDTLAGSKVAARGRAYEAYFTEYLIDNIFSMQVRYTYINYDYTGSNGFFGNTTGTPVKISTLSGQPQAAATVDVAQDIRIYLRYRY